MKKLEISITGDTQTDLIIALGEVLQLIGDHREHETKREEHHSFNFNITDEDTEGKIESRCDNCRYRHKDSGPHDHGCYCFEIRQLYCAKWSSMTDQEQTENALNGR